MYGRGEALWGAPDLGGPGSALEIDSRSGVPAGARPVLGHVGAVSERVNSRRERGGLPARVVGEAGHGERGGGDREESGEAGRLLGVGGRRELTGGSDREAVCADKRGFGGEGSQAECRSEAREGRERARAAEGSLSGQGGEACVQRQAASGRSERVICASRGVSLCRAAGAGGVSLEHSGGPHGVARHVDAPGAVRHVAGAVQASGERVSSVVDSEKRGEATHGGLAESVTLEMSSGEQDTRLVCETGPARSLCGSLVSASPVLWEVPCGSSGGLQGAAELEEMLDEEGERCGGYFDERASFGAQWREPPRSRALREADDRRARERAAADMADEGNGDFYVAEGEQRTLGGEQRVVGAEADAQTRGECASPRYSVGARELLRMEAAARVQRSWRRWLREARVPRSEGGVDVFGGWSWAKARKLGNPESHVRFLQWLFRALLWMRSGRVSQRAGAASSELRPWMVPLALALCRRRLRTRCRGGRELAGEAEFAQQRQLAQEMLDWYSCYVTLLRRLESGRTPQVLHAFAGGGGAMEGTRRAGGVGHGVDLREQADLVRRFGAEHFTLADATSWHELTRLKRALAFVGAMASPPCQWYSLLRTGRASEPPLIGQVRDALQQMFDLWVIENVLGARPSLSRGAIELDGAMFGLRVSRARLFEASFPLVRDESVWRAGRRLEAKCCLGERRRWRRLDAFGRPAAACCGGNIFSPLGKTPWRCTSQQCAEAMGVDQGHMSYERLAQAIPPAYAQLIFGQMCMYAAASRFGAPVITFDQLQSRPESARRLMAQWLRGAGGACPALGMRLESAPEPESRAVVLGATQTAAEAERQRASMAPWAATQAKARAKRISWDPDLGRGRERVGKYAYPRRTAQPAWAAAMAGVVRAAADERRPQFSCREELREVYYSHAGGFTHVWGGVHEFSWLSELRCAKGSRGMPAPTDLRGRESLVCAWGELSGLRLALEELDSVHAPCGRALVLATREQAAALPPGVRVACQLEYDGEDVLESRGLVALAYGRRGSRRDGMRVDYARVREHLDERDLPGARADGWAKAVLSHEPIVFEPERWRSSGMPSDVIEIMAEGAAIELEPGLEARDVPHYKWAAQEAMLEACMEADRALLVGHVEYVPDELVEWALATGCVHPWSIQRRGDKWRLCHDYTCSGRGVNRFAKSAPFALPSVWDVPAIVKPGTHFAKYDLRDGFWHVPVRGGDQVKLMTRHPATQRLMWCRSLPFGFVDSPRLFCKVTEAIAQEFRRRVAGRGMHILAFVDDFLLAGDSEELTREACSVFEALLAELGVQWAPHKQRGPTRAIEFLGLLVSNVPGLECVALGEERQAELLGELRRWLSEERCKEEHEPRAVARLLGQLVFASQTVRGGRTYMQGMLAAFKGLEVDWNRGVVRPVDGVWTRLELTAGFWRDIEWFESHLVARGCVPLVPPRLGEAAITGTDASDWGCGTVAWLDGQREELQLEFTAAERRRPINWRELLGILRIIEVHGPRLAGKHLLIESDSMVAVRVALKLSSKAADMQELLRRLLDETERYGITFRACHTPGVLLERPDQTSRGDAVEEPRVRLRQREFEMLQRRFGPFTELLGAERQWAVPAAEGAVQNAAPRLWMHPSHSTVGSALRLLTERMAEPGGAAASGLIIVPDDPTAAWYDLVRHFGRIGAWGGGDQQLEMLQLGRWVPVAAKRPSLILAFPRAAGARPKPVRWLGEPEAAADEYAEAEGGDEWPHLPLPRGALIYAPPAGGASGGYLYVVWSAFDPRAEEAEPADDGERYVQLAELRAAAPGEAFALVPRGGAKAGSFYQMCKEGPKPWWVSTRGLWAVDGLAVASRALDWAGAGEDAARGLALLDGVTFSFNEAAAVGEIRQAERGGPQPASDDWLPAGYRLEGAATPAPAAHSAYSLDEQQGEGRAAAASGREVLAEAQRSAERGFAERRAPAPAPAGAWWRRPPEPVMPRSQPGGRHVCRYAAATCAGCGEFMRLGAAMEPGGAAMAHAGKCAAAAKEQLRAKAGAAGAGVAATTLQAARVDERFSDDVVARLLTCSSGRCAEAVEPRLDCLRCGGRGVHVVACLHSAAKYRAAGRYICPQCRVGAVMGAAGAPNAKLLRSAARAALLELSAGAISSAGGYAWFGQLERRWVEYLNEGEAPPGLRVRLPRHCEESFSQFVQWVATEAALHRSFGTIVRAAGATMAKLELVDHTKSKRVKALIKELEIKTGVEAEPSTFTTRRMARLLLDGGIGESYRPSLPARQLLVSRLEALFVLEMNGLRVGEGAGDMHGLLANNISIATRVAGQGEFDVTCEVKIESTKTVLGRTICFVGETRTSRVPNAAIIRRHWKELGLEVVRAREGNHMVERPDYVVVRVSLVGMGDADFARLLAGVQSASAPPGVLAGGGATAGYLRRKRGAQQLDAEQRFVNIEGGGASSGAVAVALRWLQRLGLGRFASVVPGPLLRATTPSGLLTHMPLSPGSVYGQLKRALEMAYAKTIAMETPDPELELAAREVPKWSNHSNRRFADKVARETMERGTLKISTEMIDYFFGWKLEEMSKEMQLHYAGLDRGGREELARCTAMI